MSVMEYGVILAAFLGISWVIRLVISTDTSRRVSRKTEEERAGFCSWPREVN